MTLLLISLAILDHVTSLSLNFPHLYYGNNDILTPRKLESNNKICVNHLVY